MDHATLSVDSPPVPASRPRVTRSGNTFYPKRHMEYKEFLDAHLRGHEELGITGPCEVRFMFVMPPYKTSSHPVHRSDVDNLAKLPMDCMTKSERFWADDDLVVNLMALKRFAREGEEPHTKVRVIRIPQEVEDYVDEVFYS